MNGQGGKTLSDERQAILDALEAMERRLVERIDALEARVAEESTATRLEIATLRGDVAGLAREIIDTNDFSVRESEGRLRAILERATK